MTSTAISARGLSKNYGPVKAVVNVDLDVQRPRLAALAGSTPESAAQTYRVAAACDLLRRRRLALEQMRAGGILVLETEPARLGVQVVRRYLEIRKADLQ